MAKIFTMTIFIKPDRALEWSKEPSIDGRVILCDDMRFYGFARKFKQPKDQTEKLFHVHGAVTRHGKMDKDGFRLGFYCLDEEFEKLAYYVPMTTFTGLADGNYGTAELTEEGKIKTTRAGRIRIDFREYKEGRDAPPVANDKDLRCISAKYEELSRQLPHNETLLNHVNFWRKAVVA